MAVFFIVVFIAITILVFIAITILVLTFGEHGFLNVCDSRLDTLSKSSLECFLECKRIFLHCRLKNGESVLVGHFHFLLCFLISTLIFCKPF